MKKLLLLLLAIPMLLVAASSDRLTISNETDRDVYVAVYYVPGTLAARIKTLRGASVNVEKASNVLFLPRGANDKLDRPATRMGSDRQLLILTNDNFPSTFTVADFNAAGPSINVGHLQAKRFYIDMENGQIRGYTKAEWDERGNSGAMSQISIMNAQLADAVDAQLSRAYHAVVPDRVMQYSKDDLLGRVKDYWVSPYESVVADVRVGNRISVQEQAVLGKRMAVTRATMEAKFGKINSVPKIAVVASGGGYRAMIFTLGFFVAAEKTGLLDMITWASGLSGSTWALACWLENNAKKGPISPGPFRSQFLNMIKDKSVQDDITLAEVNQMSDLFLTDILYVKPLTLVNIYGALLANQLFANFGSEKQILKLSDQQTLINKGNFPIPIYTAVSGEEGQPEYYWYAFTPWEVSMEPWTRGGNGISVPSWGYGRKYRNGKSTGYMPEQSLGFQLGTFGSAFSADVEKIYNSSLGKKITVPLVHKFIEDTVINTIGGKRLTWSSVSNFGRGVPESPLRANDALQLVDAGLDFNLPYPPVSGMRADRMADIMIFVDASANIIGSGELKKTEEYARKKGLKFPKIDYAIAAKNAVSIHQDVSDPSVPIVIYVSRINDVNQAALLNRGSLQPYKAMLSGFDVEKCTQDGACNTFNFRYSFDIAMKLSMLAEFNVMAYLVEIFNAIKQRAMIAS